MFRLFRLLFSATYWKTLFRGETWRQTHVSLRRAHKDARARKHLRAVAVLLATPFLCLLYVAWIVGRGPGLAGGLIALITIAVVSIYRSRKPVERDGPLTLDLNVKKQAPFAPAPEPPMELRNELAELALLHAVLADRAGSESFLRTKILPEGVEVITRRKHLDILRVRGMYERLGREELDLLLMPDGHWTAETIAYVSMVLEPLRLLRWVVRFDGFLPIIGAALAADYRLAGSIVNEPEAIFRGDEIVDIASLRTGIQAAEQYFYRCWAEGVRRGFYQLDEEDKARRLREYAGGLDGKEDQDFLLGTEIVSRASDGDVRLATTLGLRRVQVLSWVRSRMYRETPASEELKAFFAR